MTAFLLDNEAALRLFAFAGVFAAMIGWEGARSFRPGPPRRRRWTANLGLAVIDALALRLLLPAAAVSAALWAQAGGVGLFNLWDVPAVVALAASVALLDLAVWAQHVVTHKIPLLWRLHRVHHSDVHFDATTGVRFHPAEILLSMLYKVAVVVALGAPAVAVIVFEIVLNASSLFNHGNVRLPARVERNLRTVIVTPDFHRIHHSARRAETDSNYGFFLSVWDRLFGTYRPRPAADPAVMTIGLEQFRDGAGQSLLALLTQPVHGAARAGDGGAG